MPVTNPQNTLCDDIGITNEHVKVHIISPVDFVGLPDDIFIPNHREDIPG